MSDGDSPFVSVLTQRDCPRLTYFKGNDIMKKNILKNLITISAAALAAASLCACSAPHSVGGTESAESSPYNAAFAEAAELIPAYKYEEARESLNALKESIGDDAGKEASFMRAEADYALGRVCNLLGDSDEAYDFYNSAYVYYRDILGPDDPRTADARLQLAFLSNTRNAVRYADETENSNTDQLYKNIAYCLSAENYYKLDNKKEADKYLGKLDTFANVSEAADVESAGRLYGESFEIASALGRLTMVDRYREALESKASYLNGEDRIDEAISAYEEELTTLGADMKSEIRKADILSELAALKMQHEGKAEDNEYIEAALSQNEKIYKEGKGIAALFVILAEKHYTLGNYTEFYNYLTKAKSLVENESGKYDRMNALIDLRLAAYYTLQGDHAEAVSYAEESLDIYKALVLDDSAAIGSAYNILANSYTAMGQTDKQLETYEKSEETYRQLGRDIELASTLRNHALITNNTFRRHEEAMKLAREAIAIVEEEDHDNESKTIAAIYMVMADIVTPSDPEYGKIEEYCKKAYSCLQNAVGNTDEYFANYYYNYGNYLKDNMRYEEALSQLSECERLFGKIYDETWKYPVDVLFDMGQCLYYTEDYPAAKEMLERAISYEDQAIENVANPGWCRYLEQNRSSAEWYLSQITSS